MTANEYQKLAMRTCPVKDPEYNLLDMLANGGLGMVGEAGECADMVKKHLFQGHDLDKEHLAKELGDVCWYIAATAYAIGYDFETILQMNIDKLSARYPEGHFEAERSVNRAEGDV
jgi:NTP pyrophosphatase (non-canonical NTP hydrolase)